MFHIAVAARDLQASTEYYQMLGCRLGRQYETHTVLNFFGHQLVIHKAKQHGYIKAPKMYPNHYGLVLDKIEDLEDLWKKWQGEPFIFEPYFVRHFGKPEEHHTFFLKDPSNNVIEFKWYKNDEAIFGCPT